MKNLDNYSEIKPYLEKLSTDTLDVVSLVIENQSVINNKIVNNNKVNINILKNIVNIIDGLFKSKKVVIALSHSEEADRAYKIIAYYFAIFYLYLEKSHPFIKYEKLEEIVDFISHGKIENNIHQFDCEDINFYIMINKHFETDYVNCNYNIFHFLSNGILIRRCYETMAMYKNE